LVNPRLERIREKALAFSAMQRAKGQRGGRPRRKAGAKPARLSSGKVSSVSVLQSSVRTYKNAAAPLSHPAEAVEKSKTRQKPSVRILAAMILRELLPKGIPDNGELMAAAKDCAKQFDLKYDGRSIAAAIASAQAQRAKRGNGHL
jgi:hypothetical protein